MVICDRHHGHMVMSAIHQNGINPQVDAVFVSND